MHRNNTMILFMVGKRHNTQNETKCVSISVQQVICLKMLEVLVYHIPDSAGERRSKGS